MPRLSPERCRSLLGGAVGGHLALSRGALPLVVPVTCALADDYLLVRTGLGWLVRGAPFQPGIVAFLTSSTSVNPDWRWEVVAQGRAKVLEQAPASYSPPPLPLVGNELTAVLRMSLEILTGWQYGVPPRPQRS
jgi:Pyridoxamine 5'-phosphate oxidase